MDRNEILESVYRLLLEQKSVQEQLLRLAFSKKDCVVKNNTEALNQIVQEEYAQLSRMNNIEKKRGALLAEAWGDEARSLTIGSLAKEAGGDLENRLLTVQKELSELISTLQECNQDNKALLQIQLEYTEMMVNFLGGSADPLNNFYGTDGRSADAGITKGSSVFDTEI